MVHRMGHFKLEWVMHWKVSEFLGGCALNLKDEGGGAGAFGTLGLGIFHGVVCK